MKIKRQYQPVLEFNHDVFDIKSILKTLQKSEVFKENIPLFIPEGVRHLNIFQDLLSLQQSPFQEEVVSCKRYYVKVTKDRFVVFDYSIFEKLHSFIDLSDYTFTLLYGNLVFLSFSLSEDICQIFRYYRYLGAIQGFHVMKKPTLVLPGVLIFSLDFDS